MQSVRRQNKTEKVYLYDEDDDDDDKKKKERFYRRENLDEEDVVFNTY